MLRTLVRVSCAVAMAAPLFVHAAAAQTIDGAGGYSYRNEAAIPSGRESIHGWFGALGGNVNDALGAFFQFSRQSKTFGAGADAVDVNLSIIGGGPRLTGNQRAAVTYFVNALFGTAKISTKFHEVSESLPGRFAFQPAVGVDVKAGGTVGIRFEFAPTYIKPDADEDAWAYHFLVGIVVRGG